MGRPTLDRAGIRYERLVALREAGRMPDGAVLWLCRCDCGKEAIVRGNALQAGQSRSCGCLVGDTRNPKTVDLAGQRFGRLVAVERTDQRGFGGAIIWRCACDCGNEKFAASGRLKDGNVRSCGCLHRDNAHRTHGMAHTVEYKTWSAMKSRCGDPNNARYADYGGRGIKVCDRWLESFENFFADVGLRPGKGYSLDRVDTNGNYEASNVRWATTAEQHANRRGMISNAQHASLQAALAERDAEIERLRAQLRS